MADLQSLLPFLAIALPLVLAAATLMRSPLPATLAPLAALPALAYTLLAPAGANVEVPWLLLGMQLGLTETTRIFLLFTAALWLLAGLYARSYLGADAPARRFFTFYLLTMCGNLGLVMARDVASFYLFFSLMGFAAYGLVVHDGTEKARWAGKVYLILVLVGEAMLLPAILLAVAAAGTADLAEIPAGVAASANRTLIVALVLGGFGVKAGALPLHVWLPLAHPAAPTPASAVLSGAMIKAGLLGWLLFLPLGEIELAGWGTLCVAGGLAAAFFGVLVGLTQENPKTILAYSSISQMGFMTVGLGAALAAPQARPLAVAAIVLYAAHHAFAKGALFLGLGVSEKARSLWARRLVVAGLLLAALALAGAPLTSGAAAKEYLKAAKEPLPAPWPDVLKLMLQIGAVGTTVLMGRFLVSAWPRGEGGGLKAGLWVPWSALLVCVAALVLTLPESIAETLGLVLSFDALWPVVVGVLLAGVAWLATWRRGARLGPAIPEGDLLIPVLRALDGLRGLWRGDPVSRWRDLAERAALSPARLGLGYALRGVARLESRLRYWAVTGALFLSLVALYVALIAWT
ncbi:MAG TPA: complex I subunit 5 family protein [Rubrobacteraceae bacterium]|nr:complex I subunit 5 family protein [Rubrobacteraceae bacterium]